MTGPAADAPAAPKGDTVVTLHNDRWASFGPRKTLERNVDGYEDVVPAHPRDAEFYGVYRFDPDTRWVWMADAADLDTARMIAAAYLLAINPKRMLGEEA